VLAARDDLHKFIKPVADERQQTLAALVGRRRQLVAIQVAERQRGQP